MVMTRGNIYGVILDCVKTIENGQPLEGLKNDLEKKLDGGNNYYLRRCIEIVNNASITSNYEVAEKAMNDLFEEFTSEE